MKITIDQNGKTFAAIVPFGGEADAASAGVPTVEIPADWPDGILLRSIANSIEQVATQGYPNVD